MLSRLRRTSLTTWILVSMVVGVLIGWLAPSFAESLKPLSTAFLRMIKSIIAPLIFGTLVVGIAGHGDDMKRVGRLALKSLVYFEIVTTFALIIGLVTVNITRPGAGIALPASSEAGKELAAASPTASGLMEHIVPTSFFDAAAKNEVLQVVFFTVIFAAALSQMRGKPKEFVLVACEGLSEVMFKFTNIVMYFAPIGIGAAMAVTIGHSGLGVLLDLGKLVGTLYAALVIFLGLVLVPIALLFRVPLRTFFKKVRQPALIAFSTASSEAALPRAMEAMEEMGVPRRVVAFVIPTGYSFNLDGSTLYLAAAAMFIAQMAHVNMSVGQQVLMLFTLMVTSKGVAGVPRAALVILSGTLANFGLPLEGVAVVLGVDALMDMGRTSVNVIGNCLASVVMARWEGEFVETPPGALPALESPLPGGA